MLNKILLFIVTFSLLSNSEILADGSGDKQYEPVIKLEFNNSLINTGSVSGLNISKGEHSEFCIGNDFIGSSSIRLKPEHEKDISAAIIIEDNQRLNLKDFTFVSWIKLANTGFENCGVCLFDKFDATTGKGIRLCLSFAEGTKMRYFLQLNNNGNYASYFPEKLKIGDKAEWYFTALKYSNGTATAYIANSDNEIIAVPPLKLSDEDIDTANNAKSFIGFRASTGNRAFSGNIADFRIYDRALSAEDINIIRRVSYANNPSIKKLPVVLLVGDSIRIGYAPMVKQQLANKAIVKWPDENCEDSGKILNNIEKYIEVNKPDLIYINCGLHDIKSERGTNNKKIPIETYENNLNKIISIIKSKNIKILWATTTPVIEEWNNKIQSFDRLNKDIIQYNAIASKVMFSQGIRVIDHYQVIEKADKQAAFKKDGVHYTDKGSEILSAKVSQEIIKLLMDIKGN